MNSSTGLKHSRSDKMKQGETIKGFDAKYMNYYPMDAGVNRVRCNVHMEAIDEDTGVKGYILCKNLDDSRTHFINLNYGVSEKASDFADSFLGQFMELTGSNVYPGNISINHVPAQEGFLVITEATTDDQGYTKQSAIAICSTREAADAIWQRYQETAEIRAKKVSRYKQTL